LLGLFQKRMPSGLTGIYRIELNLVVTWLLAINEPSYEQNESFHAAIRFWSALAQFGCTTSIIAAKSVISQSVSMMPVTAPRMTA